MHALAEFITPLVRDGVEVVLCMDANDPTNGKSNELTRLLAKTGLPIATRDSHGRIYEAHNVLILFLYPRRCCLLSGSVGI